MTTQPTEEQIEEIAAMVERHAGERFRIEVRQQGERAAVEARQLAERQALQDKHNAAPRGLDKHAPTLDPP